MNNVKLVYDDKELLVKLEDNMVTRELIKELPVILSFDNCSMTEKIAYINKKYWVDGKNDLYNPTKGDLMFYAPWGYFALIYNDDITAKDYVKIGKVVSGLMYLDNLKGNVRLEMAV